MHRYRNVGYMVYVDHMFIRLYTYMPALFRSFCIIGSINIEAKPFGRVALQGKMSSLRPRSLQHAAPATSWKLESHEN